MKTTGHCLTGWNKQIADDWVNHATEKSKHLQYGLDNGKEYNYTNSQHITKGSVASMLGEFISSISVFVFKIICFKGQWIWQNTKYTGKNNLYWYFQT